MDCNSIAKYYDRLAGLVFGKSLVNAQNYFLGNITATLHVLVVGGGTGWWLKEFLRTHPTCTVCYVEESSEMIRLAKQATEEDYRITFRLGTQDMIIEEDEFDAVILFCILDVFSNNQLKDVIKTIKKSLKSNAIWLVTDFVETKWWHSFVLFIMYRFFRFTTGLMNQNLPDWHGALLQTHLIEVNQKLFANGFIKSAFYR